jgi:hypothetical protein
MQTPKVTSRTVRRLADKPDHSRLKRVETRADCKKCSGFGNFVTEIVIDAEAVAGKLLFRFSLNYF